MAVSRTEQLLRRTRRRLFAVTMALLTLLVVGVGTATAVMGLSALDADVDRALRAAVAGAAASVSGELPAADEGGEPDEQPPAAADTVLLVLDAQGALVQNRSGITLPGLPDPEALPNAAATGEDLRTIRAGSHNLRLLTTPLRQGGRVVGYVQGGFILDLHDSQSESLVVAVITVGAMGLVAAALITLLVTGRALGPIRDSFDAQRQFVADASHELRTPAALIRANAEVLEREQLVADDGAPLLADVIAEADRLGSLVGDLLQLAAWDETQLTLDPVPLDLAAVAADTVRGAGALAAERGVRLELDAPGVAMASADRNRVIQLLLVLIDNALDHSPAGGTVTVRVRPTGRAVRVDVDDQGPGIPVQDRERIFEPFTRLPGSSRQGSEGTGLGLAIARRIAVAHGGTISASSPASGGARFTFTIPAADARSARQPRPASGHRPQPAATPGTPVADVETLNGSTRRSHGTKRG